MKKCISLFLAFVFLIGAFAIEPLVPTANATSVEGLTFELNDDGESYYVSKCDTQVSGELTIPDTYNDLPVTRIGIEAFFACGSLTSVTIPSNIKCIEDGAFWMCHILSNVIISNGVTDIGNGAFKNCRSLVSVSIPDTVTNIGEDVFLNCPDEMIFIVDNNDFVISYLEKNQFNYTNNAPLVFKLNEDGQSYSVAGHNITTENKIIIPNTYNGLPVTSIENSAFLACTSLTSVTIPNSIKSIGDNAFFNCSEELTFIIDNNAYLIEYLEKNNLNHTIKLPVVLELNEDGQSYSVVGHNIAIETELVIPSTYNDLPVTSIADHVFEDCIALTSVIIPNSVTSIGDFAFNSCVALTSVTIGDGVTTIGEGAFYYCVALTSITIPNSVTNIGESAFAYCNGLENVTLENGITSLGILMFEGCRSLTSITIPDTVTTIGAGAFYECIKLTNITIPDKVTSIGEAAFYYCRDLVSVTVPDSVTEIHETAFAECSSELVFIVDNNDYVIEYAEKNNFDYIVNSINQSDFEFLYNEDKTSCSVTRYNSTTETKVVIPSTYNGVPVTNIAFNTFANNGLISTIIIPESVTTIEEGAFRYSSALRSIVIPDSVTSIGSSAFEGCTSLVSISIGKNVINLGEKVFYDTAFYNNVDNWEDDVLYIDNYLIKVKDESIDSYVIKDGTKCIAAWAFGNCRELKNITIPDSVTSIGYSAFRYCELLNNVVFPDSVTHIGDNAFNNCQALTSITIPESVTSLGGGAFYYCTSLKEVTLPNTITKIEPATFESCWALENITIPDSVTSIGHDAFEACYSLKNITIPKNVLTIEDSAFDISGLENITIENGVESIGDRAFSGCPITSITIPESVISIGHGAFLSCTSLTDIKIPDTVINIGEDAFAYSAYYEDESNWEYQMLYIGNHLIKVKSGYVGNYPIKDGVKSIAGSAFYDCAGLKTVMMPDSLVGIGINAFYDCTALKEIIIPDSVLYIGDSAFGNCKSAKIIELGKNVTYMGQHAFVGCSAFKEITIPESVTTIGYRAFFGCDSLEKVNITNLTAWCKINFGNDEANPLINSGKLYLNDELLTELVIPDEITEILPHAFFNCQSITSVKIPTTVTSIKTGAFEDCKSLKSVNITDMTAWCKINFEDSTANPLLYAKNIYLNEKLVTELVVSEEIKEVKQYSFINCNSLISVIVPDSINAINNSSFYNCKSLSTVKFGSGLKSIGERAFEYCSLLKYIFYKGSASDWNKIDISGNNLELDSKLIHYNTTEHSHSLVKNPPLSEGTEGSIQDICPICNYLNSDDKLIWLNNHITSVSTKNAVLNTTDDTLLLDISACKDINEAIVEMDGYTLTTAPTSSYGFIGTGSKVQVADSTGTQVAEYTLVVRGDVNGDSVCDVLDLMLIELARQTNNNVTLEGAYFAAANLSEDSEINIDDFNAVVNRAVALA